MRFSANCENLIPIVKSNFYWFIVARNSSFDSVIPICFWRNSIASTVVISERYFLITQERFITSR